MQISESAPGQTSLRSPTAASSAVSRRSCWIVFAVLFVVAFAFACYTKHVWEDFYITYRASKNLATGNGFTFTVGERVHSYTSPLGALLPALASLLTGNSSDTAALWIFRIMSISAFAGAGVLFWQLMRRLSAHLYPAIFIVLLFATDAKMIDFTVNGMEAPYLLLFFGWTMHALFLSPPRRALNLGLAWAGLMWSRPDSFVYIGVLAVGTLLFGKFEGGWSGRKALFKDYIVAGLITTAIYGPWLIFAWRYYGSPIPHTVIAKGLLMPKPTVHNLILWIKDFPFHIARDGASLGTTFMPPYGLNSNWPAVPIWISFWISLFVMLLWLVPWVRWESRVASLAFTAGHFYLNYFAGFHSPWYVPTLTMFAFVALAGVVSQLVALARRGKQADVTAASWRPHWAVLSVSVLIPFGAFLLFLCTAWQMKCAQQINETGNRRPLGEWLRAHASSPKDTVMLECLGYIGFFSNLKMYDWPGLCSPEVVDVRRKSTTLGDYTHYFPEIITSLEPDWVVLRSSEVYQVKMLDHDLLTRYYTLEKVFDTTERIQSVKFLPGRFYLLFDSHFEVYHRKAVPIGATGLREHIPVKIVPITVQSFIENHTWAGPAYESKGNIAAHAPSRMTVTIPPGAASITGAFGIFAGAYERPFADSTFGAVFTINVSAPNGAKKQIFIAPLNPRERQKDRGDQTFVALIDLPGATTAEFITEPPPGKGNAYGWTYWTDLKFEIPKK